MTSLNNNKKEVGTVGTEAGWFEDFCWQEVEVVSIRWFPLSLKRMNKKERIQDPQGDFRNSLREM